MGNRSSFHGETSHEREVRRMAEYDQKVAEVYSSASSLALEEYREKRNQIPQILSSHQEELSQLSQLLQQLWREYQEKIEVEIQNELRRQKSLAEQKLEEETINAYRQWQQEKAAEQRQEEDYDQSFRCSSFSDCS